MPQLLDYAQLKSLCWRDGLGGYVPHPSQNVKAVHDIILRLAKGETHDFLQAEVQCDNILVLALDSISYLDGIESIRKHLPRAIVKPLTSTFPSTSITAWASMFLGTHPNEHGFYGAAFYEKSIDRVIGLVNSLIYSDNVLATPFAPGRHGPFRLAPPDMKSVFDKLRLDKWDSYLLLDHALAKSHVWLREVTEGAYYVKNLYSAELYHDASHVLTTALGITEELIHSLKDNNNLIWSFINLDPYVHHYHLSPDQKDFIFRTIAAFIARLHLTFYRDSWCVLIVADHGQVIQDVDREGVQQYEAVIKNDGLFNYPQGGAGRVRWTYSKEEYITRVVNQLQGVVGPEGIVLSKDQLWEHGLFPSAVRFRDDRLGDPVAIATTHRFPSYGHALFSEHGSISEREMFVPIAFCRPS